MSRGTRDDCQEKLDRYNTVLAEYDSFMDDIAVYKASYDLRVAQLTNEVMAQDEKIEIQQGKRYEITALLGGSSKSEALAAPDRVEEIDQRLTNINERLNEIMRLLDGSAEPSEVHALISEGEALAAERESLLGERLTLVNLIQRYNEVVEQIEQLDREIKALQAEIDEMKNNIAIAEDEAKADSYYIDTAESHASNRRSIMLEIEGLWDDFECSEYFDDLPGFEDLQMIDEEDIPDDEESIDTGDYEVPESLEEPGDPEEGEDWNPDDYEDPADTG